MRWTEQGEKPTMYFFNLIRRSLKIKLSDNIKRKLKLLRRFVYFSIFRFRRTVPLPKLCEVDKNTLEGELTVHKFRQILKTFSNRKSPGEDGFAVEFYVQFLELLAPDSLASLNAYFHAEVSISQRRGVFTLIPPRRLQPP